MKNRLAYLLLLLCGVLWGSSFIATKELFLTEPSMTVAILITLRLITATIVFLPLMALTRKLEPIRRTDLKWFLLLSLCEPFAYNLCEASGVRLVSGSLSSIIIALLPLITPLAMSAIYKERLRGTVVVGAALSVVGVGLTIVDGNALAGKPEGLLYLFGAVAVAVVYTLLLVRIVNHYRPTTITVYQNLLGLIYFLPFVLITDFNNLQELSYSGKMIVLVALLGIGCSTVAYMCYNYGIRQLGATLACIFYNTSPIFTLIIAVAVGQEQFGWLKLLGVVLVFVGVVLPQTIPSAKRKQK